jgi:hypothetical protein
VLGAADTVNAKAGKETVNAKVVVAGVVPAGPVPVTVIVKVPNGDVGEAEIAAETVQVLVGADGVQVAVAGVNTTVTPGGRADSEMTTGPATPAVVVTVKVSVPAF